MHTMMTPNERNQGSSPQKIGENLLDISNADILEALRQNANWWEQAAATCESAANRMPIGKEEWQLMGAVYRERAQKVLQLLEQLQAKGDGAHG